MADIVTIHLVVNPVAGQRSGKEFVLTHVVPLIEDSGYQFQLYETTSEGDAARIAREIGVCELDEPPTSAGENERTVVIAGGDGTAHEFIEGIYSLAEGGPAVGSWNLVLLPLGTANALYESTFPPRSSSTDPADLSEALLEKLSVLDDTVKLKLRSLLAFLSPSAAPSRLPISTLASKQPDSSPLFRPTVVPSHVVISTCLHSNLLATAEGLRAAYPGVERYKMAAQQNAGKFYSAHVELLATPSGSLTLYDPSTSSFGPIPASWADASQSDSAVIEDDFAYFLSSATCPRLEPTFVISPLIQRIPSEGTMDVTVIRPGRDPRIRSILAKAGYGSISEARAAGDQKILDAASEAWVPRAWEVLGKAYQEGVHVDLTYETDGELESNGNGVRVVEVYRCGGFEWKPLDEEAQDAHLICADGSLSYIPKGGSAQVKLATQEEGHGRPEIFMWR